MDPIAAFRKQQERNEGRRNSEPKVYSVAELREKHPRWATIYDRLDLDKTGLLKYDDVCTGFHHILGAGSLAPKRQLKKVFTELDTAKREAIDFGQFCTLATGVTQYMNDHPKWVQEETAADAEEKAARDRIEQERKSKEGPDVFKMLGIAKPKDVEEAEARKRQAMTNNNVRRNSKTSLGLAGSAIMRSGSQGALVRESSRGASVRDSSLGAMVRDSSLGAMVRDSSLGALGRHGSRHGSRTASKNSSCRPISPASVLRDDWERFSLSTAPNTTSRMLANPREAHLSEALPQVRALGKRSAGCFTLRFSPDGSQLAGGFFDGGLRIFDTDTASQSKCLNLPRFKGGSMRSAEERENDEKRAEELKQMEALVGAPIAHTPSHSDLDAPVNLEKVMKEWEPITNLRWSPVGRKALLATVDTKGTACLWEAPRNKPARCLTHVETDGPLSAVAFTCDGEKLAVAGDGRVVKTFDIETGIGECSFGEGKMYGSGYGLPDELSGHGLKILGLCAHPSSPHVMFSAGLDRHVLMWDLRLAATAEPVGSIFGIDPAGDALDITRDGNLMLTGSHRTKHPLELWDLRMIGKDADGEPRLGAYSWCSDEHPSEGGGRTTECLPFTCAWDEFDSKTIVAAGEKENLARVYERSSDPDQPLRIVGTVRGKDQPFWTSAISTDGRAAAFGSADGAVCLVDVRRKT